MVGRVVVGGAVVGLRLGVAVTVADGVALGDADVDGLAGGTTTGAAPVVGAASPRGVVVAGGWVSQTTIVIIAMNAATRPMARRERSGSGVPGRGWSRTAALRTAAAVTGPYSAVAVSQVPWGASGSPTTSGAPGRRGAGMCGVTPADWGPRAIGPGAIGPGAVGPGAVGSRVRASGPVGAGVGRRRAGGTAPLARAGSTSVTVELSRANSSSSDHASASASTVGGAGGCPTAGGAGGCPTAGGISGGAVTGGATGGAAGSGGAASAGARVRVRPAGVGCVTGRQADRDEGGVLVLVEPVPTHGRRGYGRTTALAIGHLTQRGRNCAS
ncbi:hypothetical protein ACFQX7_32380 [Luedemannella flava]